MKKIIVAALLLSGLAGFAQTEGRKSETGMMKSDMTPEQMATLRTKKLTLALDLTEAQQKKILAIQLENAKLRMEKKEAWKDQKESENRKSFSAEDRFKLQNERLDRAIAQKEQMRSILNEEQFGKWEKMHQRRGHDKHFKGMRSRTARHHGK